jgi:hypothetical protein
MSLSAYLQLLGLHGMFRPYGGAHVPSCTASELDAADRELNGLRPGLISVRGTRSVVPARLCGDAVHVELIPAGPGQEMQAAAAADDPGTGRELLSAGEHHAVLAGQLSPAVAPTWLRLVRTSGCLADGVEGLAEVVWDGVGGGDRAGACLDRDGAVAAGGADELPDRPAGPCLDPAGDGQGGEHDREVASVDDPLIRY